MHTHNTEYIWTKAEVRQWNAGIEMLDFEPNDVPILFFSCHLAPAYTH